VPPPDNPLTLRLDRLFRYWVKAGSVGGPYGDRIPVVNSVLGNSSISRLGFTSRRCLHPDVGYGNLTCEQS